jgi:nucleoside-diphosphate-sugar epimerase
MTAQPPLSDQPILVTGGGGFLGSAIIRMLATRGDAVRSFSRSRYPHLEALRVDQIQGDLADAESLQQACRGVDLVFHVASKTGVWGPYNAFHQANVVGTRNVLNACRTSGVRHLVYTSSPSVVFDGSDMEGVDESVPYPQTYHAHYPRTKAMAEQLVRDAAGSTLRTITLRPHLIWGPADNHLVPRIIQRARRLRIIGEGKNKVDTIYVDNAAHAHILAAEKLIDRPQLSGRVYFISQDEPIGLWDMVNAILAAADLPPVKRRISVASARRIGGLLEWAYRTFRLPGEPQMTRFVAEELATSHWFDIRAARKDLGYRPQISTEEGLLRLRQWLREEKPYPPQNRKIASHQE